MILLVLLWITSTHAAEPVSRPHLRDRVGGVAEGGGIGLRIKKAAIASCVLAASGCGMLAMPPEENPFVYGWARHPQYPYGAIVLVTKTPLIGEPTTEQLVVPLPRDLKELVRFADTVGKSLHAPIIPKDVDLQVLISPPPSAVDNHVDASRNHWVAGANFTTFHYEVVSAGETRPVWYHIESFEPVTDSDYGRLPFRFVFFAPVLTEVVKTPPVGGDIPPEGLQVGLLDVSGWSDTHRTDGFRGLSFKQTISFKDLVLAWTLEAARLVDEARSPDSKPGALYRAVRGAAMVDSLLLGAEQSAEELRWRGVNFESELPMLDQSREVFEKVIRPGVRSLLARE